MENEVVRITKDGKEIDCETLFTFESDDTGKHYIAYTDHSVNENNEENIYISSFDPALGTEKLLDLDDAEMEMAKDVLAQLKAYK